ncbi:MAG: ABC transporter permease [Gammaproteobacteria bacterium]|nr:ABC transporter permease [Gammaproteobacteria bacterium]MBU1731494.1 ABC transporter permease [Gammaproteobacteria bacterium]MBU1892999.1 ABC transporter permease [Gammaproteobacteria bacterium]
MNRLAIMKAVTGPVGDHPGRIFMSLLGIALGVALGVSIHLVNRAAVGEFSQAVRNVSGQADLTVQGPATGMNEAIYPYLANMPEVALASPVLEVEAKLPGRSETLRLLGVDIFRASRLLPLAIENGDGNPAAASMLDPQAVFLSASAAQWLGVRPGDNLTLQAGLAPVQLRLAGILPQESYRQRLGVMDIGAAQWRFLSLGRISRVDLRLGNGVPVDTFRRKLAASLPPGVEAIKPAAAGERAASLSRAYRVNLNVLAMVALFTGAFLVFTTQAMTVLRRRAQIALLRVLGVTRSTLSWLLLAQGAAIGAVGAALGIVLGYLVAFHGLRHFGADLGGGYFHNVAQATIAAPGSLAVFFALGICAAMLGALAPAIESARTPPAQALKPGDRERALARAGITWPGLALLVLGAALTPLPPVAGLPLFGYLSIALMLLGTVLLMPALAARSFGWLPAFRSVPLQIARAQLHGAPGRAAISMGAIVVSFSLMVAMAIMVGSFRHSVEHWLEEILPADLYLRAAQRVETAFINPETQTLIRQTPGIRQADFLRSSDLLLRPGAAPVTLIARPLMGRTISEILPLTETGAARVSGDPPPAWISEAVADLYGYRTGQRIELPIGGAQVEFTVAGIWRDYARQSGAIAIDRALYIQLTADWRADSAALWLESGISADAVTALLRERIPNGAWLDIAQPGKIRAISLEIFDRSFAVTYILEAVAVLIGLLGVSSSFGSEALARRNEFGMLRHIGMSRRQIGAMFGLEGAMISTLGALVGLLLGWLIALILILVVNRQSFHWSMELYPPWQLLFGLSASLILAASFTAVLAGRHAMSCDPVHAVREDW